MERKATSSTNGGYVEQTDSVSEDQEEVSKRGD